MKKQILCMILCALIASSVLTGCGKENVAPIEEDTASQQQTETESSYPDDLPADLNLAGEQVRFLYREEVSDEFYSEALNGDIVNDAQYNSILATEERLNADIVLVPRPGHMTSVRQEYMNHIKNSVQAGDDTYAWVDLMVGNVPVLMQEGIFMDVLQNPYIDVTKPWYLKNIENMAIDGHLYFVSGDSSLGYLKSIFCMYFNIQVAEDYQLGNIYELVDNGEWTLDKVIELTKITSQDLNGDGIYTADDKLGLLVHDWVHPKGFMGSTCFDLYEEDEDGTWKLTIGSERNVDVCNKVYTMLYATSGVYHSGVTSTATEDAAVYNALSAKFMAGEVFLTTAQMDDAVSQFRDMEAAYGILPCPKYDTAQAEYRSVSRTTHNAFAMPVTCGNVDAAGAVMEALSASNHETVIPAYFETALKTKYSRDNDSARMYDLIRETTVSDFGYVYNNAIGATTGLFDTGITKENTLASELASKKTSLESALEVFLETVRDKCGH